MDTKELVAGRELDALVATTLWDFDAEGWPKEEGGWKWFGTSDDGAQFVRLPQFSTDISAAWEVAEKLTASEASELNSWIHFSIRHREYDGVLRWEAHFGLTTATAETAPLAICLAALKAIEPPASR